MNKLYRVGIIILALSVTLLACTLSTTPTPSISATEVPQLVLTSAPTELSFEGMWVSEGDTPEIIVFTRDRMYRVQSNQVSADQVNAREQFAELSPLPSKRIRSLCVHSGFE